MKTVTTWCDKSLTIVLLAIISVTMSTALAAQQNYLEQLGPPEAGAMVPVELGNINLTNGNLHLEVPLGQFPQRGGIGFSAKLEYDSRIWEPVGYSPTFGATFRPTNNLEPSGPWIGGWRLVVSAGNSSSGNGIVSSSADGGPCDNQFYFSGQSWMAYSNFAWGDAEGVNHSFDPAMQTAREFPNTSLPNCSPYGDNPTTAGYATDGSGLYMIVTNYQNAVVYDKNGNVVGMWIASGSSTFLGGDTNGNYFSVDSSGNVIDTLGRTPVITTTSGNNVYYDVLNSQGARSRYTLTTTSIPVSVPGYSANMTVVQSITLPNNTTYTLGYDSGTTGDNWGLINDITLPTGGEIKYGYTTFTDALAWSAGQVFSTNRWVTSRISGGGTTTYTPLVTTVGTPSSSNPGDQQTTVSKPNGDKPNGDYIIYKSHANCAANNFLNKERDYYDAKGTLLKKELIDYVETFCVTPNSPIPPTGMAARVQRFTTVVPGQVGSTISSKTEYDYTNSPSVDNPTKVSEWNSYIGTAPTQPDRVRQVTYSLTGNSTLAAAHIIAKPLTVTLTDGASTPNQIAQTSYTYDNYTNNALASTGACQSTSASQPSPAAPQHDYQAYCTSNAVRGNLTQVSKWLNTTGASITLATNTFDDTGNIVKTQDALSNPTTFEFSPSYGRAYVTKATNALGHVTTKTYDFNTGLTASVTDPNGQTTGLKTSMIYDNMGRLIETDLPDPNGGKITTSFNGDAIPLTITTTQTATPDPSIVKTTVLDGLGRTQTECLSDPEGNGCVDTAYDSNGRLSSKSNPHRATAAASDGTTSFHYDGLDRTTSVTEPDGNIVSTTYDTQAAPVLAQTVTTTDETARQRRSATDGFGRLVEADEPGDGYGGAQASGSLNVNGSLQNHPGTNATPANGWVTITGSEGSFTVTPPCEADQTVCPPSYTVWDFGTVTVTVNGFPATYDYSGSDGGFDNPQTVAAGLATALNSSSSPVQNATVNGATVSFVTKAAGVAANYSLSGTSATGNPTGFSPSFIASASGPFLTHGTDGTPTVWDSGTVTLSVGANSATVNYGNGSGQDSTAGAVASDLAAKLMAQNPPFTISASGGSLNIIWKTVGAAGNMSVVCSSSTNQSAYFSQPSFTCPSITLSGGSDPYTPGLSHPYVSRYFYDLLDNLTCVEQHGNTTGSGCSPAIMAIMNNQPPAADANSPWRIRRFAYDSLSRPRWANDPESGLSSYTYDNNGNLISEADARGVTINYSPSTSPIDALNRITSITYSDGTPTVTYKYDASCCGVTSLNPLGRTTSAYTGNTELVFSYDSIGRVLTQWDCPPSGIARGYCYVLSALYDAAGQMTSLTYPDGRTVTASYSSAGRTIGVNLANFGGTAVNLPYYTVPQSQSATSWGYWPSGAMNRGTFGNGVVQTTGYNNRSNINSIADVKGAQTLLSKTYGLYDASGHNNGNIFTIVDGLSSSATQSYAYDSLNRLVSGSQADNAFNVTINYDPWGNIQQRGTSTFTPVYDTHNRMQNIAYDAAGNVLNDGLHAYAYDGAGRMKSVDSTAATYTYNPEGNRVRKDTSTGSTEYFFFGEGIIAELNVTTGAWTDYVLGYGGRVAKDTSTNASGAQYFQADQIASTRLVTDSAGAVVWQATYNPFGQELSAQNNSITFQFAGMQYDSETALNHTDFRQYSSAEGRWLSPDPYLGSIDPSSPQTLNRYVYVLNNPLRLRDAEGLLGCEPDDPECEESRADDGMGTGFEKKKKREPLPPSPLCGDGGPRCPPKEEGRAEGSRTLDPWLYSNPPGSRPRADGTCPTINNVNLGGWCVPTQPIQFHYYYPPPETFAHTWARLAVCSDKVFFGSVVSDLNPFKPTIDKAGPFLGIATAQQAKKEAIKHIIKRGLTYPNKSSIVRGLTRTVESGSEEFGPISFMFTFDLAAGTGLVDTSIAVHRGECDHY